MHFVIIPVFLCLTFHFSFFVFGLARGRARSKHGGVLTPEYIGFSYVFTYIYYGFTRFPCSIMPRTPLLCYLHIYVGVCGAWSKMEQNGALWSFGTKGQSQANISKYCVGAENRTRDLCFGERRQFHFATNHFVNDLGKQSIWHGRPCCAARAVLAGTGTRAKVEILDEFWWHGRPCWMARAVPASGQAQKYQILDLKMIKGVGGFHWKLWRSSGSPKRRFLVALEVFLLSSSSM
jgi:hypothetical protein